MNRKFELVALVTILAFSPSVARADVAFDWNIIMINTLGGQNPFAQARFAAITQLAVFEAVNACTGNYQPYLGTISASPGASPEAAAATAAHGVLRNYFPGSAASLDAALANSLAAIPNGSAKDAGIAVGQAAAAAMIALRLGDGSAPPEFHIPASLDPGVWQLTPSCPAAGGILLQWRNVKPFGIRSGDQFRSDPPPSLITAKYGRDYNEVKEVGHINSTERPQDRADVARFYAGALAPPLWNLLARNIAATRGSSLSENARLFALLNMALSDASVAVFDTKYHYNTWRPETAIRAGDTDDNPKTDPDFAFAPFIVTPCFPGYPSAHATLSNAARKVIERVFGLGPYAITLSSPAVPGVTLNYTTLKQITDDIDDARVYGGIHFRFDQEAGTYQGRRIGSFVCNHNLRRLDGSDPDDDD